MARSNKPAGDLTGRQTETLLRERADQVKEASDHLAMTQQMQDVHDDNIVVDYTDPQNPKEVASADAAIDYDDPDVEVVEEANTEVAVPMRTVKIMETFSCTIGYGNNYDFVAGRRYTLPAHVIAVLDEKGFVA